MHGAAAAADPADAPSAFEVHGQSTLVLQAKSSMRSPYAGSNSLRGEAERGWSWTGTLSLAGSLPWGLQWRLDPEAAAGVPFSNLTGMAGFTNGELAKSSGTRPKAYLARAWLKQTVDAGALGRFEWQAGLLPLLDLFDVDEVAHDPRTLFMNWSLMTHAAYDYPADARGYTRGLSLAWLGDGWSVRVGRFAMPKEPNGLPLDLALARHHGDQIEVTRDYAAGERRGRVRLLAWQVRMPMARYDDALAAAAPGTAPQLESVRDDRNRKHGIGIGIEHPAGRDATLFARAMRADGGSETVAFTEADASWSVGGVLQGAAWGQPAQAAGLALAGHGLSTPHREYLARGGTTSFLGDGRLNAGGERIVEGWWRIALGGDLALTLDLQHVRNPGFNRDRGPVNFGALRLHWER